MTGSFTLGQAARVHRMLEIHCKRCQRGGRLNTEKLVREHGADLKLPDLGRRLAADCPQADALYYDKCSISYPQLLPGKRAL